MFSFKKIVSSFLLGTMLITPNILAKEQSNYSIAVELARAEKVDSLIQKINELKGYLKLYVFNSGDTTPTIAEINNFAVSELSATAWNNYDGNTMLLTINGVSSVSFGKIFTNAPSAEVLNYLLNSNYLDPLSKVDNINYVITIPFDAAFVNFLKATKELESNPKVVISATAPSDTSKIWYKPDGQGGYTVSGYNPSLGKWVSYGTVNFATGSGGSGGSSNGSNIVVKSFDELNSIPPVPGLKVYVSDGAAATEYIWDGSDWVKSTPASDGGVFNGDGTIYDMATKLISKSGGSIVTASDPFLNTSNKYTFAGARDFTKKDNSSTNGYWVDATNTYVIGATLADISTQNWANGTYAYLPKSTGSTVHLLKRINNIWMYVADGYADVSQGMVDAKANMVWDKKNNEYFRYSTSDFWYSTTSTGVNDNVTRVTNNINGRNVFTGVGTITKYLVLNNDCTSTTCNGTVATDYFAGTLLDGMRVFYYATAGNRKNNLIDAVPASSIADIYNRLLSAGLYNNSVYFKDVDSNNKTCYKDLSGVYYTKSGVAIPTGNNLPTSRDCTTAMYSGNYLILDNRTQATDWITAPHAAGINVGGTNYAHILGSGKDFWTNNGSGDGQVSATEIFTKGSRTSFPVVTHSINALTKLVDTPNYTTTGVVSSIDNSFKQWFYSSSGTNNLVDAISTTNAYLDNSAISVGVAIQSGIVLQKCSNHWCRINTSQVVDSSLVNGTTLSVVAIGATNSYTTCSSTFSTNTQASGSTIIGSSCNKAPNGLWYDSCEAGNISYTSGTSYCTSKGMRIPSISETTVGSSSGVPSCVNINSNWNNSSWTTTTSQYCTYSFINNAQTPYNYNYCSQTNRTLRCVK